MEHEREGGGSEEQREGGRDGGREGGRQGGREGGRDRSQKSTFLVRWGHVCLAL